MNQLIIIGLLALNLAISWLNCWSAGRIWDDARVLGGWIRLVAWSGAIQAAIGFSSAVGIGLGAALYFTGHLSPVAARGALSLWYLLIIIPALGTGFVLTIESWIVAFRERSLLSIGTASWNSFAQVENMSGAFDGLGDALDDVGKLFDSDDEGNGVTHLVLLLVVGLVAVALAGGVLLTYMLIRMYAGTLPKPGRAAVCQPVQQSQAGIAGPADVARREPFLFDNVAAAGAEAVVANQFGTIGSSTR